MTNFYSCVRSWVSCHYEVDVGSYVLCEEIVCHANREKDDIMRNKIGKVTANIVTRAVHELFGDEVTKSNKRSHLELKRIFRNLKKKSFDKVLNGYDEEWTELCSNVEKCVGEGRKSVVSDNSVSFLKFNDMRIDDKRTVFELILTKDDASKSVVSKVLHDQRAVPIEVLRQIEIYSVGANIVERTKNYLSFLDKSSICCGFESSGKEETLCDKTLGKHLLRENDSVEERLVLYSSNCEVLADNSSGKICSRCRQAKKSLAQKNKRNEEKTDPKQPTTKFCNNRYLSREELIDKISEEKTKTEEEKRKNRRLEKELLEVEETDHSDLSTMMASINEKDVPTELLTLWKQQQQILETKSKKGYRWHPRIMRLCIEIYSKNPHVLDPLRKLLYLPSNRTIRYYKNRVDQRPGWSDEILKWCLNEAKESNAKVEDYMGGLVLDEMKIQEDLEMVTKDGKHRLVGFVDLGELHDDMKILSGQGDEPQLASHVLQFIFIGDGGFRFPVAQFPSGHCTSSVLFFIFWEGVKKMLETGFMVYYYILDGADINRQFIKLHFQSEQEAVEHKFVASNLFTGEPMVFLMDPKHNIKKIRNNILKSSSEASARCLTLGNNSHILWQHFINAFKFDQGEFSLSYHHKLTLAHFELEASSKMRNHLAEEVLDEDMLNLMKAYKTHLASKGQQTHDVDATISILHHTAKIVAFFNDKLPITTVNDQRLNHLTEFLSFLQDWKDSTGGNASQFVSSKLWFDLQSMILGFQALVSIKLKKYPNAVIKPAIINQDVVENHFCQIRACNGQNNNPTWRLQENTQNAIRYGQTTISRKSNAGISGHKLSTN